MILLALALVIALSVTIGVTAGVGSIDKPLYQTPIQAIRDGYEKNPEGYYSKTLLKKNLEVRIAWSDNDLGLPISQSNYNFNDVKVKGETHWYRTGSPMYSCVHKNAKMNKNKLLINEAIKVGYRRRVDGSFSKLNKSHKKDNRILFDKTGRLIVDCIYTKNNTRGSCMVWDFEHSVKRFCNYFPEKITWLTKEKAIKQGYLQHDTEAYFYKKIGRNGKEIRAEWFPNGVTKYIIAYKNNVKHGTSRKFYDNGVVKKFQQYQMGQLVGVEKSLQMNKMFFQKCNHKKTLPHQTNAWFKQNGYKRSDSSSFVYLKNEISNSKKYLYFSRVKFNDQDKVVSYATCKMPVFFDTFVDEN